jgi:hypothetical protein
MDSKLDTFGNEPRPIHHALFGREVVVKSVDDLVMNHDQSRFVIDAVGVVEQLNEHELRDFVDLYAAQAETFAAEHIRTQFARRSAAEADSNWGDNQDMELAVDIAHELQGEINRRVLNTDVETPLLRVLFPL